MGNIRLKVDSPQASKVRLMNVTRKGFQIYSLRLQPKSSFGWTGNFNKRAFSFSQRKRQIKIGSFVANFTF